MSRASSTPQTSSESTLTTPEWLKIAEVRMRTIIAVAGGIEHPSNVGQFIVGLATSGQDRTHYDLYCHLGRVNNQDIFEKRAQKDVLDLNGKVNQRQAHILAKNALTFFSSVSKRSGEVKMPILEAFNIDLEGLKEAISRAEFATENESILRNNEFLQDQELLQIFRESYGVVVFSPVDYLGDFEMEDLEDDDGRRAPSPVGSDDGEAKNSDDGELERIKSPPIPIPAAASNVQRRFSMPVPVVSSASPVSPRIKALRQHEEGKMVLPKERNDPSLCGSLGRAKARSLEQKSKAAGSKVERGNAL
jgi:hypothetical protein